MWISFDLHEQMSELYLLNPYLISLISLLTLWFLTKQTCKNSSGKRLPPSPPTLPILGNLHQLSNLTHRSLLSLGTKYGPIMHLRFGSRPVIVVQSTDAASEIMKTYDLTFAERPHAETMMPFLYDLKNISSAPYGEYWRKMRSIVVLQLLSTKRVHSFSLIRAEETAILMNKVDGSCGTPVSLRELFDSMNSDVFCRVAFGRKYSQREDGKFLMLLRELMQLMGGLSVGDFIPSLWWIDHVNGLKSRVKRVYAGVDKFLEGVVQEHLDDDEGIKDESRVNFVDVLLDIWKDNSSGVPFDRTSIKAIILDIIIAGTETTSAGMEWAMTELLRHSTVLNKLQKEVRGIMQDKHSIIRDEELGEMKYLKAVVKETLRLHPPIPLVGRVARQDARVMGYDVAAGTMAVTNIWAIGRDPSTWDEPDKFIPERFLNSSLEFNGLDSGMIPFGSGRRGCPGLGFGLAGLEGVLANLVHKFEWGLPDGTNCNKLDITEQAGGVVHRKHPLFAVASRT